MDTVISNKYNDILSSLDIEVSKKLEGEYEVDEIISTFGNFFFNKMFLDITAIKNYKDLTNLQKLSMNINMDKVIVLLDKDDSISDSNTFLSKLVNMGIYNFTKDSKDLMYLYKNPNTYRDVAYLQSLDTTIVEANTSNVISNFNNTKKILGIKNITDSAGSTTLTYMLKKVLSDYYNVMALEIDKRDFIYFQDKDCLSIKENEIDSIMARYSSTDIFLIDLNKSRKEYICSNVLYLIEPTTIKLNKLALINSKSFDELKNKDLILNKSLLSDSEIADFEVETGLKVYYNIPPLNDKKDVSENLLPLLEKLGYVKVAAEEEKTKKNRLFNFFK